MNKEGKNTIKVINASFVKGVVDEEAILYDETPQIVFVGKSNVGKSTTLNAVLDRNKLVKTGRTPGKTREINFFLVKMKDDETDELRRAYIVDLPGYGYAKLSKDMRATLQNRIYWYLSHPVSDLKLVVLILDARRGMSDEDRDILNLIRKSGKDYLIVVNKIDKLNQKESHKLRETLNQEKGIESEKIIFISAIKKKLVHHLRDKIFSYMERI